jgi:hypothetical protein
MQAQAAEYSGYAGSFRCFLVCLGDVTLPNRRYVAGKDCKIIAGSRLRVESQKCSCSAACTPPDLIWLRRISDMQQQAEHQVAPKETGKLCGHFNGIAFEEAE